MKTITIILRSCVSLFVLTFVLSCNKTSRQDTNEKISFYDSNYITLFLDEAGREDQLKMSSIFQVAKPIILELNEMSLIGKINKLEEFDDKLIILDRLIAKSIFVFNKDGHFLYRIGNTGGGPGEYSGVSDLTIDRDNGLIYILDHNRQIINIYRLDDGQFLYDLNIRMDDFMSFNIQYLDGLLYADIFYRDNYAKKEKFMLRTIDIKTGKTNEFLLDIEKYNKGFNEMIHTGKGVFFSRKNNPLYIQSYMDTILSLSHHHASSYVVLNSKYLTVKKDLVNSNKKNRRYDNSANTFVSLLQLEKFHSLESLIESDKFILIKCYFKNIVQLIYYDKIMPKTTIYSIISDDVLFKTFDPKRNKIMVDFLSEGSDGMYAHISDRNLTHFIEAFQSDELNGNIDLTTYLSEINENSNPIIILYEYK